MLKVPSFCEQEDCINKKALKVGFLERFLLKERTVRN